MKKSWPPIRKTTNHGKTTFLVDARHAGKGERRFFSTRVEAEGFAQTQRIRRQNEGGSAFDDSRLAKYGWTVAQAIRFALDHLERQSASVTVEEAVRQLIESKAAAGRSPRYTNDLHLRLGRLAAAMGEKSISQISTADLEAFLSGLTVAAETRNTFRRDIRTLWSFSEKRGWAEAKTAKNTERARSTEKPPGILRPEEAAALLAHSHDAEVRAFHAIGLFSGLRVAEIMALDWREIDFEAGLIHVSAENSKTRSRRLVPIQDNLKAWLQPIAKAAGKVVTRGIRKPQEAARLAAGITPWPENCMRHSFVSYRLANTGNAAQTALESGHDQSVLFRHYRELVKPADAARYFEITPQTPGNVISISEAAA